MPDLFTPRTWVDGELVNAAAGPNRWEQGIDALDEQAETHDERLSAIQAQLQSLSSGRIPSGPTSARPSPAAGQMFFDTTLGKAILGTGGAWIEFGGGSVGGPGSSQAPTGFTATVQPDNSIVLAWNPVSGASHYKIYETRSPEGVEGADNITGTTNTRTPGGTGVYEYWVTAFSSGVESAHSAVGRVSLPFGSDPDNPGTPGGAGSPAELLAIGAGGGDWNLGVGRPSGHVDITPSQLLGGWSDPSYFYLNDAATAVVFRTPMSGGTTSSNTKYARTELREYRNGAKASWSGTSGTHIMSGRTRVRRIESGKPEIVVAQIHDGDDDRMQIRVEGTTWRCNINGSTHSTSLGTFSTGTEVAWESRLVNGTLTIRINGSTRITTNPGFPSSGNYHKVGLYLQQNDTSSGGGNPSNGYGMVELRDLVVTHS